MSTPNIQILLQAQAAILNNLVTPETQIANLDFGNPTLPSAGMGGTAAFVDPYFQADPGGSAVSLPNPRIYAVMVKNLDPTANLQVSFTPFGQSVCILVLGPGGQIILFDQSEAGSGFIALTLSGVGGTVPAAVLVGY